MPTNLLPGKGRTNSQPAPKLVKVVEGTKKPDKPRLGTVKEELSQSGEERSAQRFAEAVFGEKVPAAGTTYGEIAMKKAAFEEDKRRSSTSKSPTSGQAADTSKGAGRTSIDQCKTPSKPATPTPYSQAPAYVPTPKSATYIATSRPITPAKIPAASSVTPRQDSELPTPGVDAMKVEESGFPLPEPRQSLPLSQTYATNRKSWHASQSAIDQISTPIAEEVKAKPEESKKSTPKWALPQSSQKPEATPMQEIKLFAEETTPMVVEESFPPKSPSKTPVPPSSFPSHSAIPSSIKQVPEPKPIEQPRPSPSPNRPHPFFVTSAIAPGSISDSQQINPLQTSPSPIRQPPASLTPVPISKVPESDPQNPLPVSPSPISRTAPSLASTPKPSSQPPTPKSILKKSVPVSPQPIPLPEVEAANTDASDSESSHPSQNSDEAKAKAMLTTPVQKRKRLNAALLTEFDVPAEAFSDCDIYYDSQALSQSAKRRKRTR